MNRAVLAAVLVLVGAAVVWYFYAPAPAKPLPPPAMVPAAAPEQNLPQPEPPAPAPQAAPAPEEAATAHEAATAAEPVPASPDPIDPPPPPPPVGTVRGTLVGVSAPGEKASISLLAGELEVPKVLSYEWLTENNGKTVAVRPLPEGSSEYEFADINEGTYTLLAGIVTGRVEEIPNWRVEGRIIHLRKGETITENFDLTKK
jgi:hypothetical protein